MAWLGDLLNFRFKWRKDAREERGDERAGRGELLQLIDQQIDNVQRALELVKDEAEREALSRAFRSYRARKDSILETQIQFHPAMPSEAAPALRATLAPISAAPLPAPETSDAADELFLLGETLAGEEQWLAAATAFHRVQQLRPSDSAVFFNRGVCLHHAGRYEEALADYNRSLELDPSSPDTLNNRGVAFVDLKRYEEALADYDRALELRPDDPDTLNNRGVALRSLGRYEEALADYNRALQLEPDHSGTLMNRGNSLGHLGRYEEALADYNRALQLEPEACDVLYNRACLYSMWKKLDEAIEDLRLAIAGDEKYRAMVRTDADFDNIRSDPRFQELVGGDQPPDSAEKPS